MQAAVICTLLTALLVTACWALFVQAPDSTTPPVHMHGPEPWPCSGGPSASGAATTRRLTRMKCRFFNSELASSYSESKLSRSRAP